MGPEIAADVLVHDRLEQRTENGRGNLAPIERTAFQQGIAHVAVEGGGGQTLTEQAAVDIGKGGQLFIEVLQALPQRPVKHLEQMGQPLRQVLPVLGGALFDQVLKLAALEDAGVLGEQAEQQADQINLQLVTV